jgi:hypothetical protein
MAIVFRKVVVTGGRHFIDAARVEADLRSMMAAGTMKVAQGGNNVPDHDTGPTDWKPVRSADALALYACGIVGLDAETYQVKRHLDGPWPAAGNRRNRRMLKAEMPDAVLAYPDPESRGTWNCVADAHRMGIPVAILAPAGKLREEAQALRIRLVAGSIEVADRIVLVPSPHSPENVKRCDALAAYLEGLHL